MSSPRRCNIAPSTLAQAGAIRCVSDTVVNSPCVRRACSRSFSRHCACVRWPGHVRDSQPHEAGPRLLAKVRTNLSRIRVLIALPPLFAVCSIMEARVAAQGTVLLGLCGLFGYGAGLCRLNVAHFACYFSCHQGSQHAAQQEHLKHSSCLLQLNSQRCYKRTAALAC